MMITGNYGAEDVSAIRQQIFQRVDTDGSGTISKDELGAAISKGPGATSGSGGPSVEALFAQIDTNGDGSIDQSENNAFLQAQQGQQTGHAHRGHGGRRHHAAADPAGAAAAVFGKADTDGDGSISKSDLLAALPQHDNTSAIDQLFADADSDGDGSISQTDLAASLQQHLPPPPPYNRQGDQPPLQSTSQISVSA
jgi:Ca2+-binding EF-hand superfamily protein